MKKMSKFSLLRFGALLVAFPLVVSGCASLGQNETFFGKDKILHFSVTGVIAAVATCIADKPSAIVIGGAAGLGAGLAKELYDGMPGGSGFSSDDMIANTLGTGAGVLVGYALCHPAPPPQKPELIEFEKTNEILLKSVNYK